MNQNGSSNGDLPLVLTMEELAETLKIGSNAAYRLVSSGALRCVRIGKSIRIPRSALMEYLDRPRTQSEEVPR